MIVYGLLDPRDRRLRYIGATKRSAEVRVAQHYYDRNTRNDHRSRWVRLLAELNLKPIIVVLQSFDSDRSAMFIAERVWIARFRAIGCPLTNASNGGEGRDGPLSAETRARMSAAHKGKTRSTAHRAAISAALKGRLPTFERTPEWRAAHAAKLRGKQHSIETKAKMSAAAKGRAMPGTSVYARSRARANGRFI